LTLAADGEFSMSIVISGAGGQLGRRTAELLAGRPDVEVSDLVLVTRRPEELADLAGRGAQVRHGDFDDPATLPAAFAGADRLLLISTDVVGGRVAQHRAAVDAAKAAGASLIVYTSVPNPGPENPAQVCPEHHATETYIRASGVDHTFLRNALYSELRINDAKAAIASGIFHHNIGDGRVAPVSREDCAAVAAAVLAGGDHAGRIYDLTGPELLGADDLAAAFAALGDVEVTATELDDAAFAELIVSHGLPPFVGELVASLGRAIREGHFDQHTTVVADLTGRPPRALRDVLEGARAEVFAA
jgi:NAD(P)H dehydrogenase (quinone)